MTGEQLGVSEDLVKDAVDMYWNDIRKAMVGLKHHSIRVHGLGTFKLKFWKLEEKKEEYTRMLKGSQGTTFRKMAMKMELEDRIQKIIEVQKLVEESNNKKQSVKDKRYGKKNLEEQVVNTSGDIKLDIQEEQSGSSLHRENEDMQPLPSTDQDK
jgi:recombinational DNA repair protein RecT